VLWMRGEGGRVRGGGMGVAVAVTASGVMRTSHAKR